MIKQRIEIGLVLAIILGAILALLGEVSWWIPTLLAVSGITLDIK